VVLVPNVVNLTQSSAQSAITSAGLVVGTITLAYSDTVTAGRVISQNPVGGSTAVVGSAVNLTISQGPAPGSWTLYQTSDVFATVPSPVPTYPVTVSNSVSWTFYSSGPVDYKIEIAGIPTVGGTWTATPSTGSVFSSGTHTISFTIDGTNIDLSSLSPGSHKIAQIDFYIR
jgi:hypothetical protein